MHSFPSRLIHAPRAQGGLGLLSASETIFLEKWALVLRGLFSPDSLTQSVTHSILEQALTNSTLNHAHQMHITLPSPVTTYHSRTRLFTDILLLHGDPHHIRLSRSGTRPTGRELPLTPTPSLIHVHTPSHLFPYPRIGYLQSTTDPPGQWSLKSLNPSITMSPTFPATPPPLTPLRIAVGQLWLSGFNRPAFEIVGWSTDLPQTQLWVHRWTPTKSPRGKDLLHRSASAQHQLIPYSDVFPSSHAYRLATVPYTRRSSHEHPYLRVCARYLECTPTFAPTNWHSEWLNQFALPEASTLILTDGSVKPSTNPLTVSNIMRGNLKSRSACAVVFLPTDWTPTSGIPISVLHITECETIDATTPAQTELFAMAVGMSCSAGRSRQEQVYTDLQSIVDLTPHFPSHITKSSCESYIPKIAIIDACRHSPLPLWIRAHPNTKQQSTWTLNQWGTHIADTVAKGKSATLPFSSFIRITTIPATAVYPHLLPPDTWHWTHPDGSPLGVLPLPHYLHSSDLTTYTKERDEFRAQRHLPPYWSSHTLNYAFSVWEFTTKQSHDHIAYLQRILLDKRIHGRNIFKMLQGKTDPDNSYAEDRTYPCPLCHDTDSQ